MTSEAQGKWTLARMNCDTLPGIAEAMQIKNLPTVYFVADGAGQFNFTGIPSEVEFNTFVNNVKIYTGHSTEEQVM
jgi:thioredoxin-like negative regulator of GroEL